MEKYVKVFIGRFQPFHNGHLKVLRASIDTSDHMVVVLGSVGAQPSLKNPWNWLERHAMIKYALRRAELDKVSFMGQADMPGQDGEWVQQVRNGAKYLALQALGRARTRYSLVGCHKGADTYYLKLYRGWNRDLIPQSETLNATDCRRAYFGLNHDWAKNLPGSSAAFLACWRRGATFRNLRREFLKEQA